MSHKNEFISIQGSGACYRIFLGLQGDGPISGVRVCVWRGYKLRGGGGWGEGFKAAVCDTNDRY